MTVEKVAELYRKLCRFYAFRRGQMEWNPGVGREPTFAQFLKQLVVWEETYGQAFSQAVSESFVYRGRSHFRNHSVDQLLPRRYARFQHRTYHSLSQVWAPVQGDDSSYDGTKGQKFCPESDNQELEQPVT